MASLGIPIRRREQREHPIAIGMLTVSAMPSAIVSAAPSRPCRAVLADGLLVYPTGSDLDLAVRRHPGHPCQRHHRGHLWGDDLRLEVRFADGRSADNDPAAGPAAGLNAQEVFDWRWPAQQIPSSQAVARASLQL